MSGILKRSVQSALFIQETEDYYLQFDGCVSAKNDMKQEPRMKKVQCPEAQTTTSTFKISNILKAPVKSFQTHADELLGAPLVVSSIKWSYEIKKSYLVREFKIA